MKFDLTYYPNGSSKATATVCVESEYNFFHDFCERAKNKLDIWGNSLWINRSQGGDVLKKHGFPEEEYDTAEPAKIEFDGNSKGKETREYCLNEEDVIFAVLSNAISMDAVSFTYKNDRYTEIKSISLIHTSSITKAELGLMFSAIKNGGEKADYCLFTKNTNISNFSDGKTTVMQTPSTGIVEIGKQYHYAGSLWCQKKYVDGTYEEISSDDIDGISYSISADAKSGYVVEAANLFFEKNGDDYTFYVLVNGVLKKRIERTANYIRFYAARLVFGDGAADEIEAEFTKKGDKYIIDEYWFKNYALAKAVNTYINMPVFSDDESLTPENLAKLYMRCENALHKAFENSEKYFWNDIEDEYPSFRRLVRATEEVRKRVGTENPPKGQIEYKRGDNYYLCDTEYIKGAETQLQAHMPGIKVFVEYDEKFAVPFPSFTIIQAIFKLSEGEVVMKPHNKTLFITINDNEKGTFNQLMPMLDLPKDFPNNPIFLNCYPPTGATAWLVKICQCIEKAGLQLCKDVLGGIKKVETEKKRIKKDLYDGMIPDESVVAQALKLENRFKRTKQIPNIEIIGQAGIGKTTLARQLGKLFGRELLVCSPADLKGAYIGHTEYRVVEKLAEAAVENKIFYIDEAYELMSDQFGREAVSILLPLMTGDRTKFEVSLDRAQRDTVVLDFGKGRYKRLGCDGTEKKNEHFEPGVIPVWISGYDNEVRAMISQNQGLYRRFEKIVIKPPIAKNLYKVFMTELDVLVDSDDQITRNKADRLKKHLNDPNKTVTVKNSDGTEEHCCKSIMNFFSWGSQVQNSKYFANNAGAKKFLYDCIDAIDFTSNDIERQMEDIISDTKIDIKRQLAVSKDNKGGYKAPDISDTVSVITDIDTRFDDLVGCEEQVAYLKSIIEMLVNSGYYNSDNVNLTVPKGALMIGPPGTGKTFIARAMAGELQERFENLAADKRFGFMSFSASDFAGNPEKISKIFAAAEEYNTCIMFIDEVDAIAKHRSINKYADCYMELIKQMDGIEKRSNVFILAATNAPDALDPAFKRPGRIDKVLKFELPDDALREEIAIRAIKKHRNVLESYSFNDKEEEALAAYIAKRTYYRTAGVIDNIVNNAFVAYHQFYNRNDPRSPIGDDFFNSYSFIKNDRIDTPGCIAVIQETALKETALKELYMFINEELERLIGGGIQKRTDKTDNTGKPIKEKFSTEENGTRSAVAIHEVGHAVVSLVLGDGKPFESITTVPRGDAMGYVVPAKPEDKTKADYEKRLQVYMGGRAAEELFYGKENVSPGAMKDLQDATNLARRMIELAGFSEEIGFMALSKDSENYLGDDDRYTCSDEFRARSDAAINELLKRMYSKTLDLLKDNKELVEKLAKIVFDEGTMTGEEFKKLYNALNPQAKQ